MSRIFLSHSSRDTREAIALKQWLVQQTPPLANEIFLDVDAGTGLQTGTRWKDALRQANNRCEAVICLLSRNWEASHECKVEYRTAENLNKQIFVARLEPSTGADLTSEWQRCDLFGDGPTTSVDVGDGTSVDFATAALYRLRDGIRGAGIGADSFVWPPPDDPHRAPYRGWEPLDEADAAVFFGRDAQIVRALDTLRGMRTSGVTSLFVVLGPSGTGKSSFLRAGLLPRLRREDRRFVVMDIVRPERNALTGEGGIAASIGATRAAFGLTQPSLGEIKAACESLDTDSIMFWLNEIRREAASQLLGRGDDGEASPPTLILPLDQAEELFNAEAAQSGEAFLGLVSHVLSGMNATEPALIVAATIRTDRYEILQTHPQLAGVGTELFDELKPMPPTQFKEVIVGPAERATDGGARLRIAPDLVDRLLADAGVGGDTLPMLALTLARLHADYGSTGEMTLAQYETMGGMRRVVHTEIDEVLSGEPQRRAEQLQALRWAFIPWLATVDPDSGQPMRRVARTADLPPESLPLIDALVAKRLMVRDVRDGTQVVEVALESLLRQWDELAGWLRDERNGLRDADDLVRNADAWRASDHNPSWLLEGTRLAEATTLVNRPGFAQRLMGVHDYLNASYQREAQRRDAEEQRRQGELAAAQERARHAQEQQAVAERHTVTLRKRSRILRAVVAITAVVAVIAVVGFVRANAASNEAREQFRVATSQRLLTDAQAMLDDSRIGSDEQALQQLTVSQRLAAQPDRNAVFDAAVATSGLAKIFSAGSEVISVAVSADGRRIAAGGDGEIWLWDTETGERQINPMTGHDGGVATVVFSPDGSRLVSSGADSTVRVWNVETGEQEGDPYRARGADGVRVVGFNDRGTRVMLQDSTGRVVAWNIDDRSAADPVFPSGVERMAINTTAHRAATLGQGVVKIWDTMTGTQVGGDLTVNGDVFAMTFSHDGSRLAAGGLEQTVQMWDTATAAPVGREMTDNSAEVTALAFAPDGGFLAAAAADGTVRFFDVATQAPLGAPLHALDGVPRGLAMDADGKRLVIGGSDQTVRSFVVDMVVPHFGQAVAFGGPDGAHMVTGGADGVIRLWNRDTGEVTQSEGRMAGVTRVAYLSDGEILAADSSGTLQRWDAGSGRPIGEPMATPGAGVLSMVVSSAAERALAGYTDGTVRLWDTGNERLIRPPWKAGDGAIAAVGFLEDDRVAAVMVTSTSELFVWDSNSGNSIDERSLGHSAAVAFGPDGRIAGGRVDGSVTFMTGIDGDVIGREDVKGHPDAVVSLAYDNDGDRVASSGRDGSVRLWDAGTGMAIGKPLPKTSDMVFGLAFAPDGQILAAGSATDNTVQLWPAAASVDDLCAKLTTNMSHKHWNEWVSPDIDYVQACPDLPIAPD